MNRRFRLIAPVVVALTLCLSQAAHATGYTQTRYPIVLAHGLTGFNTLFGVVDYFYGISPALAAGGAQVFVTDVSPFNSPEVRGEQLLSQIQSICARTGAKKVNLIGHSQGGLDARYVASVRPDLLASVTTVGTPHQGAELATYLRAHISNGSFTEDVLSFFAGSLGMLLDFLTGYTNPQNPVAALDSLTAQGAAKFNAAHPLGLPTVKCGNGPASVNGVALYSWGGTAVLTNVLDASDGSLGLASTVYSEDNDGLVGRCSSHFGTVLRDDYVMNHLDEVNQVLGLTALFFSSPVDVFTAHANRLKRAGL